MANSNPDPQERLRQINRVWELRENHVPFREIAEELVKAPIESLANSTGIDMGDLAKLRQRAISWLSAVEGSAN